MFAYLVSGAVFGLSAGISPGPLLTLVITETLRGGLRAGIRVAFAPLITDIPIVVLTLFIISTLTHFNVFLGSIALLGALFVAYLGYESLSVKEFPVGAGDSGSRSLKKGVVANLLNPHPYLFWFSVGSPLVMKAYASGLLSAAAFVGSFYVLLVGSKVAVAVAVSRSRDLLAGNAYRYTMMALGVVLFVFAAILLREGLILLGWWPCLGVS